MYKILIVSWGGTEKVFMEGLTLDEAYDIYEDNHGIYDDGYVWDLVIEEDDSAE